MRTLSASLSRPTSENSMVWPTNTPITMPMPRTCPKPRSSRFFVRSDVPGRIEPQCLALSNRGQHRHRPPAQTDFYPADFARPLEAEPAIGAPDPARATEAALLRKKLDAALDRVSAREKTAFLLRFDQELSLQEIAAVLDVSVGSVKSYLFRSGRKLRRELSLVGLRLSEEVPHA